LEKLKANKSFPPPALPDDLADHLNNQKRFADSVYGSFVYDLQSMQGKNLILSCGLTPADISRKVFKIYNCSNIIEIREKALTGETHIHNASYCKNPLVCSICSARAQAIRRKKFEKPLEKAIKNFRYVYMVTATIKDGESLSERIATLRDAVRSFVRFGQSRKKKVVENGEIIFKKKPGSGEFGKVKAGFLSLEIKRGENSRLWHPHCHGLFFCNESIDFMVYDPAKKRELHKKYGDVIPKEALKAIAFDTVSQSSKVSREWAAATKGQGISIDISPVTTAGGSVLEQCKEVIKYTSLLNPNEPKDAIEIIAATYGKRFFSTYGDFRRISKDDFTDTEPKAADDKIYYALWSPEKKRYSRLSPARGSIYADEISDKRKRLLGDQARLLGNCRRNRRALLDKYSDAPGAIEQLEAELNEESDRFRAACKNIWQDFHDYEYNRPDPEPVQVDLFNGVPVEDESWRFIPDSWRLPQYQ
jgi:hypothetical protein